MKIFDPRGKISHKNSSSISGLDNYETPDYFRGGKNRRGEGELEISPSLRRNSYTNNYSKSKQGDYDEIPSNYYSASSPKFTGQDIFSPCQNELKLSESSPQIIRDENENFESKERSVLFKKEIDQETPRIEVKMNDTGTAEKIGVTSNSLREIINVSSGDLIIENADVPSMIKVDQESIIHEENEVGLEDLEDELEEDKDIFPEIFVIEVEEDEVKLAKQDREMEENEDREEMERLEVPSAFEEEDEETFVYEDNNDLFDDDDEEDDDIPRFEGSDYKLAVRSIGKDEFSASNLLNSPLTAKLLQSYYSPYAENTQKYQNNLQLEEETTLGKTLTSPVNLDIPNSKTIAGRSTHTDTGILQNSLASVSEQSEKDPIITANFDTFSQFIGITNPNPTSDDLRFENQTTNWIYSVNDMSRPSEFANLRKFQEANLRRVAGDWKRVKRIASKLDGGQFCDLDFEGNLYSIIGDGRNRLCLNLITLDYLGWLDSNLLNFKKIKNIYKRKKIDFRSGSSTPYQGVEKVLNILRDSLNIVVLKEENLVCMKIYNFKKRKFGDIYTDLQVPIDKTNLPLFCNLQKYGNLDLETFSKVIKDNCLVLKLLAKYYGSYDNLLGKDFSQIFSLISGGILAKITTSNFFDFYREFYRARKTGSFILFKDPRSNEFEFLLKKSDDTWALRDLMNNKIVSFESKFEDKILKNLGNFGQYAFFDLDNFSDQMSVVKEVYSREELTCFELKFENEIIREERQSKSPEVKNLVGNWKDWVESPNRSRMLSELEVSSPLSYKNERHNSYSKSRRSDSPGVPNQSPSYLLNSKDPNSRLQRVNFFFTVRGETVDIFVVEMKNMTSVSNVTALTNPPEHVGHLEVEMTKSPDTRYFIFAQRTTGEGQIGGHHLKIMSKNKIFLSREEKNMKRLIFEKALFYHKVRSIKDSGRKKSFFEL